MHRKLMILAAGMSSRMKTSTSNLINSSQNDQANNRPKCMIEVGENNTPFLEFLLYNATSARISEICIVQNEKDLFTQNYLSDKFLDIKFNFVTQKIPQNQLKPMGTADAVLQGIQKCKHWIDQTFVACNSDNLYSENAFKALFDSQSHNAMIDYNFNALGVEDQRIHAFSVIDKDDDGCLTKIVEKPTMEEINTTSKNGRIGVSMNIFKLKATDILPYLEQCPIHSTRKEKELPTAIQMMVDENPQILKTIPMSEVVPDLTNKSDIAEIEKYLF